MLIEMSSNGVERLNDELSGGYLYAGNGEWSFIKSIDRVDGTIEFRTTNVSYESVPHETRETAYEQFDGSGKVLVHPDGIDLPRTQDAETEQTDTEAN